MSPLLGSSRMMRLTMMSSSRSSNQPSFPRNQLLVWVGDGGRYKKEIKPMQPVRRPSAHHSESALLIRGRQWRCEPDLGSRKVLLLPKHALRLKFNINWERSAPKCTYLGRRASASPRGRGGRAGGGCRRRGRRRRCW